MTEMKSVVNCITGRQEEVEVVGAELTALQANRAPILTYQTNRPLLARIQTTTATPTEIYRATLTQNTGYLANLTLLGVDTGNGAVKSLNAHVLAKRLGAGAVLVQPPVVVSSLQDTAATTWAVGASVSGNDVVVTVTGAAGRTIEWSLTGSVTSFTPAGA